MVVDRVGAPPARGGKLRIAGFVVFLGCFAASLYLCRVRRQDQYAWWLLGAAFALALLWQWKLPATDSTPDAEPAATTRGRLLLGSLLAVAGAGLWIWAAQALYRNWFAHFDGTWIAWVVAAVLLSCGLDLMWGRWKLPSAARRVRPIHLALLLLGLLAVAAIYRLGNIATFPGEGHVSQVEEYQHGMWGVAYLNGDRNRWEFIGPVWLAALGIWAGGRSLLAMRLPFAVVSALKVIPLFLWVRFSVGTAAAVVATALFACSSWDIVLSHIPSSPDALVVAIAFALLAGPARRGRPSAYVWLGLFGGYVLCEYVAYRPLALFILMGAAAVSLQDTASSWRRRVARPLVTLLLIVSIGIPLFVGLLRGERFHREYMDGWNRAQADQFYAPSDTWSQVVAKGLNRSFATAGLFFFHGEGWQVHNIGGRPLVDPVTAALMLLGIAYGLARLRQGVLGLTVFAFGVTLLGALVATGNFVVSRAGGAVPYAYALAGYGAASVVAALHRSWGRSGRRCAVAVLTLGVLAAATDNTRFLFKFWNSPVVRQAYESGFSPLGALAIWLRAHTRTGEQVIGVANRFTIVLEPNDAAWLRGGKIPGVVEGDVETALREWAKRPGETLLLAFAGPTTRDVKDYLEWFLPGLKMRLEQLEPTVVDGDIAYAHVDGAALDVAGRLAGWHCSGVHSEYEAIGSDPADVLFRRTSVAPFIASTSWPGSVRAEILHLGGKVAHIRARFQSTFVAPEPGDYTFFLQTHMGQATLELDGKSMDAVGGARIHLDSGTPHSLVVAASFQPAPVDVQVALLWQTPSSSERALVPLYRLAVRDPDCADSTPGAP
jgi:hypothetical protein